LRRFPKFQNAGIRTAFLPKCAGIMYLTKIISTTTIPGKEQTMQAGRSIEQRAEQRHYAGIATDLREKFQKGMLSELLPYPQFVVWKYTVEQGKLKKRPFHPRTNLPAKTTDPSTWTDVNGALTALASGRYNGIGFVFSESDPFTGTDLDACVGKDGTIAAWAKEIITSLSSYTEYSPSKLGVHILTQATLPGAGRKRGHIEMYSQERYFTLTADHLPGTPTTIEQRQEEQARLYSSLVRDVLTRSENTRGSGAGTGEPLLRPAPSRSDAEVLEKAQAARNSARFQALWNGDISGYKSKSEADFTLALLLLYWTHDDIAQTKRLFQQSGLYDPEKTDRLTGEHSYLDVTIYNALRKRREPGR
jgi:putative DNA primase/helicase